MTGDVDDLLIALEVPEKGDVLCAARTQGQLRLCSLGYDKIVDIFRSVGITGPRGQVVSRALSCIRTNELRGQKHNLEESAVRRGKPNVKGPIRITWC